MSNFEGQTSVLTQRFVITGSWTRASKFEIGTKESQNKFNSCNSEKRKGASEGVISAGYVALSAKES